MSASMNPVVLFLFLVLSFLAIHPLVLVAQPPTPNSHISVVGAVYCDTCYDNSFSSHSYFLPGVDVHVQCKFKANSPKTTEVIQFSVNRTTNRYGMYKLDIPSVEGVDCVEGPEIQSFCSASLIKSRSSACNVIGLKATASEITIKSKQASLCIYCLSALSYRPQEKNITLCEKQREEFQFQKSFNSSKFFLPPYFPPYGFPWPPLPQLPPLPKLPPLPPLPPFPFFPLPPLPFPNPPSLPFPFPPVPPLPLPQISPPTPPPFNWIDPKTWIPNIPLPYPPPPAFNFRDPRTWIPNIPSLSPPPPPAFNFRDPRTWIPNIPSLSPPSPPAFNLRDPRTWIPYLPPSPPNSPQNQKP
ncbi:Major pollen allergen Ole e like [Actinidia chinensis var. chinensis]|uniref:Major pollen allergen Ole e like n=1 Tax=Actinidia chinensis var. chinensis TaxID=1590841 RepID=A0A2R6P375_ACTCC|nr:Major pollen allergen Ole e like [Actinidia chinensis var. chinensis]